MGARLSKKILPSVFKHIPFPGKAAHKVDIVEGHDFEVRNNLYPAPQKRVRSKKFCAKRTKHEFRST